MKTLIISKSIYPKNTDKTTNGMINPLEAELLDLEDNNVIGEYHEEYDFWFWFWNILFGGINKCNFDEYTSEEGV